MGAGVVLDVAGPGHVFPEALRRDRILELGEDLRVRLVQHVRHHVQPAAMRHADQDVPGAGLRRLGDHLVQDRHHHVDAFDREARLAGEAAVQEPLEGLDLRQPIEQRDRIDRIGRRAEPPALRRIAQPAPLLGHEHVRVVVAGRRAVDAAQRLDHVVHGRGVLAKRRRNQARRHRAQVLLGDAVVLRKERGVAERLAQAERIEPGREVPVAPDRLRQVDRADDLVERLAVNRRRFVDVRSRAGSTAGRARAWRRRQTTGRGGTSGPAPGHSRGSAL